MANVVHHIGFNCRDRIAQERFYTRHFGFRRVRVFNAGEPGEFVMTALGEVRVEFFGAANPGPSDRGGERKVGFKHMCIGVPDVKAKAAALKAAGVDVDPVIDCTHQVPGLYVCFFRDPEGNVVELMQGWQDEEAPPALPRA
jgi:glyoxylase I family protein